MGALSALFVFVLIAGIGVSYTQKSVHEIETSAVSADRSQSAKTALTGLDVAKEALSSDDVWGDCSGADSECSDGYYPIYSSSLGSAVDEIFVGDGKLTVLIKPLDSKRVNVISVGNVNGKKVYFASRFQKITSTDKVPLVYGASSRVIGGTVCSYYWDGEGVAGVTMPNFTVYLNDDFYWSPNIYVPNNPAGENPKDVRFATNYSTRVSGYRVIDKIYSTGDVSLENGAYVDYVYANGKVYTDSSSGYGKKVENGNFEFPNFNARLRDLTYNFNASKKVYCLSGTKYLNPGKYDTVVVGGNCRLVLNGERFRVEKFYVTGLGKVVFDDPETLLKVETMKVYARGGLSYESDSGRDSYITVKVKDLDVGVSTGWWGGWGNSRLVCSDPLTCLFDVNSIESYGDNYIQGTILARDTAYFDGSTVVGNVFGENVNARYATICNVVDKSGDQLIAKGYFDVVDPDGTQFPAVIEEVKRVVCKDVDDCDTKLSD